MSEKNAIRSFWSCFGIQACCLLLCFFICLYQRQFYLDIADQQYRKIIFSVLWGDVTAFFIQGVFTLLFIRQIKNGSNCITGEIIVFVLLKGILFCLMNRGYLFFTRLLLTFGGTPAVLCHDALISIKAWLLLIPQILFYLILGMSIYCKLQSQSRKNLRTLIYMVTGFHILNLLMNILLYIFQQPLTYRHMVFASLTFTPAPVLIYLLPDIIEMLVQLLLLNRFIGQLRKKKFSILPEILSIVAVHSLSLGIPKLIQTWVWRNGGNGMWSAYGLLELVKGYMNPVGGMATGLFFMACGISICIKVSRRKN